MAITLDVLNVGETAIDTASTTVALTTVATVAAGATIILTGTNVLDFNLTSVTNSGTVLGWTIDKQGGSGGSNAWIASAYATSGLASGTTITGTFAGSTAGGRSMCATSFKGIPLVSFIDTTSGPTSYAAAGWATASIAIAAGSLLICVVADFSTSHTNTVTGPSLEAHDVNAAGGFAATTCYRIESSAGSYTVAGTWSGAGSGNIDAVAYKADPAVLSTAGDRSRIGAISALGF